MNRSRRTRRGGDTPVSKHRAAALRVLVFVISLAILSWAVFLLVR
jgi:hypothetical protein